MASCGDEITINDARLDANIFGGYIKDITYKFLNYNTYVQICQCQDYTKLITDVSSGVTADYSAGANTEKEILTALFAAHCASITVGASVIAGALAAIKFTDSSLVRAIDELAAISDRKWYVDYSKNLHYFVSGDEAATFDLSDAPNHTTTFDYAKLEYTIDEDSLERATLITWQPGLFAGQTIGITNATLTWADKQFLITNVITRLKGKTDTAAYALEYSVTLGTIPKQRFTNEIIRAGRVVTTARIADLAVTDAKIENLTASKLTAGNLTVAVLVDTGGVLQTAASGARVAISPTGIKLYDATTQRGLISSDGSGWFGSSSDFRWTSAGVLSINGAKIDNASILDASISTCSIGKLTAGNLTVTGTITTGKLVTGAAGSNRIEIDKDYVSGYNTSNVKQFYLSAADGKAYCGAGAVILDTEGVWFNSNDVALIFKASGVEQGALYYSSVTPCLYLETSVANKHITISSGGYLYLYGASGIDFDSSIASDIDPKTDVTYELGNASYSWKSIYAKNHVIDGGAAEAIEGNLFYDNNGGYFFGVYINGGFRYVELPYTV